jgi:poly-gamma-glutamate capsule biosynthesis protein CapA/YwtB (metallophosphatase superfamily)
MTRATTPDSVKSRDWAPLTLAIAGDVMLGRLVNDTIARRGLAYPWGDVLTARDRADLFLINLECALTASHRRWSDGGEKTFYFGAEPAVVETLKLGRVDFVSLANNHAGDFGDEGLLETLRVLEEAGIAHAGAGPSLHTAHAPAILTSSGVRVGVVAFADYPREWAATDGSPGINYTSVDTAGAGFADVRSAIAEARRDADVVVFSIHWGPNMRARPTATFRDFAHHVIDAGVDVFWGHSAHVVQGIERWHRGVILYDTGDFIDDYAVDPELRNDRSALFFVRLAQAGIECVELLPVQIDDMQVNVAQGSARAWFISRLTTLCAEMGTEVVAVPGQEILTVRRACDTESPTT